MCGACCTRSVYREIYYCFVVCRLSQGSRGRTGKSKIFVAVALGRRRLCVRRVVCGSVVAAVRVGISSLSFVRQYVFGILPFVVGVALISKGSSSRENKGIISDLPSW